MKKRNTCKKLLAAALGLAMMASLAACSGGKTEELSLEEITGKTYTMEIADCQATALVGESYKDAVSYGYKNLENGYFKETNTLVLGENDQYKLTKYVDTGMADISMAHFVYVFSGTYTVSGNQVTLSAATYAEVEDEFGGYVVALANGVPHTGDAENHTDDAGTVTGGTGTSKDYPEILEYFNSEVLTKSGNSEQVVTISDELGMFAYGENAVITPSEPDVPDEPSDDPSDNQENSGNTAGSDGYTFSGTCAASEYFAVVCTLNADGTLSVIRGIPNEGDWMMSEEWSGTWSETDGQIAIVVDQTDDEQALGAAAQSTYTAENDGSGNYSFRWYKNGLTADGNPAGGEEDQAYYSDLTIATA